MNERIEELANQAGTHYRKTTIGADMLPEPIYGVIPKKFLEKFAELIVEAVLDDVSERSYYSGDRAWSDSLDRRWVELEFSIGKLAEMKNE